MRKNDRFITASLPKALLDDVNDFSDQTGLSRSYAVRQGLALFLRQYRHKLTETLSQSDKSTSITLESHHAA